MAEQKAPWYVDFAKTVGVPTAMLCLVGWGIFESIKWTATEILVPWGKEQSVYVKRATELAEEQAKNADTNNLRLNGQAEHTVQMMKVTTAIQDVTEDTNTQVKLNERSRLETANKMLDVLQKIEENTQGLKESHP